MKKYLLCLIALFASVGANAEPVVLSDTSVDEDYSESSEPFVAPQSGAVDNYSSGQIQPAQSIQQMKKNSLATDTSDPLFLVLDNKFLSDTYVAYADDKLRIGEYLAYGVNNNFAFHINMHYQVDFTHEHENGFSSTELGGTYRMNHGTDGSRIISDTLFGLKVGGASRVRSPEYADSLYYAGLRLGRQFAGMTLSGTAKSTWIFDDDKGLSYLDFIPEVYFRFQDNWRSGIGFDIRRSTNPHLMPNQEWLNLKVLRQFGNTQYVGKFDYEFEYHDIQVGLDVKILF